MKQGREARHVRGILNDLLKKWEQGTVKKGNAVLDAWQLSIGERAKDHACPLSFKKGTLLILVENSAWLYQLTLEKKNILKKFNENYTGRKKVVDIRFRVGTIEE
ncbi:MAG: DUF721 domain-containing protein [Candidatus Tantalella remota]|nr:DUF721 domain-containing protein [Candidatus Tantalella remota]